VEKLNREERIEWLEKEIAHQEEVVLAHQKYLNSLKKALKCIKEE